MELKNLNSFFQVARYNSFTKAAEVLGYSQSNISVHIQQLEDELGVKLFHRINRRVVLTHYGQALLPYVQKTLTQTSQIETLFLSKDIQNGDLRIGLTESLFETFFEQIIVEFHARYPQVCVEVIVDATSNLIELLQSSRLDIALIIEMPLYHENVAQHRSWLCSTCIVANAKHPLAMESVLSAKDIDGEEFILTENTSPYNAFFLQYVAKNSINVNCYVTLQSPRMIISLLKTGNYLSILPDYTVQSSIMAGDLAHINLPDYIGMQTISILTHKNTLITPQIEVFFEAAAKAIEKLL